MPEHAEVTFSSLFRSRTSPFYWDTIEAWNKSGIADASGVCLDPRIEVWVEFKVTYNIKGKLKFKPMQPPWLMQRRRRGSNVYVAVRHYKWIHLYDGLQALALSKNGIIGVPTLLSIEMPWSWSHMVHQLQQPLT